MEKDRAKPGQRFIFHITHLDNLPAIVEVGGLWSDRHAVQRAPIRTLIGYEDIKRRRLDELAVHCHSGTKVGDYVPFYFCPRSPMLYVIYKRNAQLKYRGGQERVIHLVSTVETAIQVAAGRPWAFSDGNAGARYTQFSADLAQLDGFVDWQAVEAKSWSDPAIKEKKQAEFLVHDWFPWEAFVEIGVMNPSTAAEMHRILEGSPHQPKIAVKRDWYY